MCFHKISGKKHPHITISWNNPFSWNMEHTIRFRVPPRRVTTAGCRVYRLVTVSQRARATSGHQWCKSHEPLLWWGSGSWQTAYLCCAVAAPWSFTYELCMTQSMLDEQWQACLNADHLPHRQHPSFFSDSLAVMYYNCPYSTHSRQIVHVSIFISPIHILVNKHLYNAWQIL